LASKEHFETSLGLARMDESITMPGVVQNSKKISKIQALFKNWNISSS